VEDNKKKSKLTKQKPSNGTSKTITDDILQQCEVDDLVDWELDVSDKETYHVSDAGEPKIRTS